MSIESSVRAVRERAPLTSCITNSVVVGFTANVLLAAGASPAMVDIVGEAGPFATVADGLLVNLGTPTPEQRAASLEAVEAAAASGTPWVLDPVAVGGLPVRTELANRFVGFRPTVIRGNPSEIIALAGLGGGGRGVDSQDTVEAAADAARSLAERFGSVVAVSGETDAIVSADRSAGVGGGSAMLTRVTGGGCALGSLIAAFCGAVDDPFEAAVSAHAFYSAAAELAAERSSGPGSFAVALLDALAEVGDDDLARIPVSADAWTTERDATTRSERAR